MPLVSSKGVHFLKMLPLYVVYILMCALFIENKKKIYKGMHKIIDNVYCLVCAFCEASRQILGAAAGYAANTIKVCIKKCAHRFLVYTLYIIVQRQNCVAKYEHIHH